eukprot:GILI01036345.1.p1 GENE.GILI01036345.1~~GILI01036345.1.p1  ORF type:complete len:736 (-),score=198.88 GILI01036345.1:13-2019(-)
MMSRFLAASVQAPQVLEFLLLGASPTTEGLSAEAAVASLEFGDLDVILGPLMPLLGRIDSECGSGLMSSSSGNLSRNSPLNPALSSCLIRHCLNPIVTVCEELICDHRKYFFNVSALPLCITSAIMSRKILHVITPDSASPAKFSVIGALMPLLRQSARRHYHRLTRDAVRPIALEELSNLAKTMADEVHMEMTHFFSGWTDSVRCLQSHFSYDQLPQSAPLDIAAHVTSSICYGLAADVELSLQSHRVFDGRIALLAKDLAPIETTLKSFGLPSSSAQLFVSLAPLLQQWLSEKFDQVHKCVQRSVEKETWEALSEEDSCSSSAIDVSTLLAQISESLRDSLEAVPQSSLPWRSFLINLCVRVIADYSAAMVMSCGDPEALIPPLPPLEILTGFQSMTSKVKSKLRSSSTTSANNNNASASAGLETPYKLSQRVDRLCSRLSNLQFIFNQISNLVTSITHNVGGLEPEAVIEQMRATLETAAVQISDYIGAKVLYVDLQGDILDGLYIPNCESARLTGVIEDCLPLMESLWQHVPPRYFKMVLSALYKFFLRAFLTVLLDGGPQRSFTLAQHELVEEDFCRLKSFFLARDSRGVARGLSEDEVESKAAVVSTVLELMNFQTKDLIDLHVKSRPEEDALRSRIVRVLYHRSSDKDAKKFLQGLKKHGL